MYAFLDLSYVQGMATDKRNVIFMKESDIKVHNFRVRLFGRKKLCAVHTVLFVPMCVPQTL